MESISTRTAPDREAVIRRLRWLFWTGIAVSLVGIVILAATVVLHIKYRNAGLSPLLLRCLRLRFYVAPFGSGVALAGMLGLIGLRAWQCSLQSLLIWTAIAGLLLGIAAGIGRSHNNEAEYLNFVIQDGGLSARYDYSREGGGSGSIGIRLLFYGWNEITSWHYWTMLPFLTLPLLIKWPVHRRGIYGPQVQTSVP
jgi:hypothetical protein